MPRSDSTCWTAIREAAEGTAPAREVFARSYAPIVAAYLGARWRSGRYAGFVDDAVQEILLECFRSGGALEKADPSRPGGFRAFLYGIARNVALRFEKRLAARREVQPGTDADPDDLPPPDDAGLSVVFDRAFARAIMKEAGELQADRAEKKGDAARRRVELLRLRFQEGLPIRDIAARWNVEAASLHHEYAQARKEFQAALRDVVAYYHPDPAADLDRECANLLDLLA